MNNYIGTIKNNQKEGINMLDKQKILEIIVFNVSQFNNFETFELFENTSKEEFSSELQLGFYLDLTLGSYNGQTNHFTPRAITNEHIYDSIVNYLHLTDYDDLTNITENLSVPELVYEFALTHNVLTLNNRIYLKL